MKKTIKANKFIIIILLLLCLIFISNPALYSKSCLSALSVWAMNIVPVMFPFFVASKLILSLSSPKANYLDKAFNKFYNTPASTSNVFFLSLLAGYPTGAKLISDLYSREQINQKDAKRMLSFCSISGPMFIIGTVGVSFLLSYKAGIIILVANIIGALINGFIYRSEKSPIKELSLIEKKNDNLLYDSVYDSLISILMIGGFIILSFVFIDMLNNLNIISILSNTICSVFNCRQYTNTVSSVFSGLIEITRGILDLSQINQSLITKTIISSGLIAFSGISIFLQSLSFLSKLKISVKTILLQKTTQAIITIIVTTILCFIIF